jgi:hypothetical protein
MTIPLPDTYDPKLHYNCYLEAAVQPEFRQRTYQELKRRGKIHASHILPDGRLQLIISDLHEAITSFNSVLVAEIGRIEKNESLLAQLKHDQDELARMSWEGVLLLVYMEPEPTKVLNLNTIITTINKLVNSRLPKEDQQIVFRTSIDRLQENIQDIPPETIIIYQSKLADYWHYIFIHAVDQLYVYGQNDRKVLLPYCSDGSGSVLLQSTVGIHDAFFPGARALTDQERKNINVVYTYRPYQDTAEDIYRSARLKKRELF